MNTTPVDTTSPETTSPAPSTTTPQAGATPAPIKVGDRVVLPRADGRQLRRTTIYMEVDLAARVAVYAAENHLDQTTVIKEALLDYLAKHAAPQAADAPDPTSEAPTPAGPPSTALPPLDVEARRRWAAAKTEAALGALHATVDARTTLCLALQALASGDRASAKDDIAHAMALLVSVEGELALLGATLLPGHNHPLTACEVAEEPTITVAAHLANRLARLRR